MREGVIRQVTVGRERSLLLPGVGFALIALASAVLGPEVLAAMLIATFAMAIVASRPAWGVAGILTLLMVQYGSRRAERTGIAAIANLIPNVGLLTPNNMLGLFLAVLLVYRVYREHDWEFLRNRQVRLALYITGVLILSALWNEVDYLEQAALGLRIRGQDPMRMMVSRALFLMLFVAFVREPRSVRGIVWLFVGLTVVTAWSGSSAALFGGGRAEVAEYRAGGMEVLLETGQNPNRLAMLCTLALIFIWEWGQTGARNRFSWLMLPTSLLLIVTVFLSASRGGVLGLGVAGLLLLMRRGGAVRRYAYAAMAIFIGAYLISQIVPPEALERLSNIPGVTAEEGVEGSGSIQRRQYTYGIAVDLWSRNPLIGIGLGNWSYFRFVTDPLRSAAAPHNAYLKALAEGGLVVAVLYALLFFYTLRDLGRLERDPEVVERARADGLAWVLAATRVSLMSFLVFSIFADLWELIFCYMLLGLAAALIQRYEPYLAPAEAVEA